MKNTTNVFLGGLKTDYHPLTQDQKGLTDALNATLITYNGNEMMLQNDMGNTKIQDSTTGNIMGLRDGFVPLGMKEYGGILYIASYNLNTKEGELGTIPSPVFNYTADAMKTKGFQPYCIMSGESPLYDGETLIDEVKKYNLYTENPYNVSDNRFQVGDQFIFSLAIDELEHRTVRKGWFGLDTAPTNENDYIAIEFPYITQVLHILELDDQSEYTYSGPGWFRLDLLSKTANSDNAVKLEDVPTKNGNWYSTASDKNFELNESDYWFIGEDITDMDVDRTLAGYKYQSYPNIEPGYLWVKLEPEMPYGFNTEKITVHVTFVGDLPTFEDVVPPEEPEPEPDIPAPEEPNTPEDITDIPAYNKYGGRLLTIDLKYIEDNFGWVVAEADVTWYLVVEGDEDKVVGTGYYLTTEDDTSLPAGYYYARVDHERGVMKTIILKVG